MAIPSSAVGAPSSMAAIQWQCKSMNPCTFFSPRSPDDDATSTIGCPHSAHHSGVVSGPFAGRSARNRDVNAAERSSGTGVGAQTIHQEVKEGGGLGDQRGELDVLVLRMVAGSTGPETIDAGNPC